MVKLSIIEGVGFGDEGKGAFVNYLCTKTDNPLVVRFNGGQQVGHTVVLNEKRHIFSNFGSGTLRGIPTYWSEYCTVDPIGVQREGHQLNEFLGIKPKIYYNANAMITTPFDKYQNRKLEGINKHGSVGVGFGTTIQRNEDHYHLYVRDLKYPKLRDAKLENIWKQYYKIPELSGDWDGIMKNFITACDELVAKYKIVNNIDEILYYDHIIFEGGQGILLDQNYGFFPNVTRSNTTSKNAIEIINKLPLFEGDKLIDTYYITRAYQTRHGNGYMSNQEMDISYIKENPNETNVANFQGIFRKSVLDLDLLKYAIECDRYHNPKSKKNLVITCLDQITDHKAVPLTLNGKLITMTPKKISEHLLGNGMERCYPTYSDTGYSDVLP